MKSVDIFPWNENFNTGIAVIDAQHEKLVGILNQLASHIAFNADIPETKVIIGRLTDYTVYHFQTEERIWHQYLPDDPLETGHRRIHQSFIDQIAAIRDKADITPTETIIEELLGFLTRWLANHILDNDRYLALLVQARQSGMGLEAAKAHADEQMRGKNRVLIDIILSIYESFSSNALRLMREISERQAREDALNLQARRAHALLELPRLYETMEETAFLQHAQEIARQLTGSQTAFMGFVPEGDATSGRAAWAGQETGPTGSASGIMDAAIQSRIWAEVASRTEPVVIEDYPAYCGEYGIADHAAPLTRLAVVPAVRNGKVAMLLGVADKATEYTATDVETLQLLSTQIWHIVARGRNEKKVARSLVQTVGLVTMISEMRDPYTVGHERRVAEIAVAIGTELGLDSNSLEGLRVAGYLHDVGKISIPIGILIKPGRITAEEYELIKQHPQAGYDVLKDVDFPWPVAQIALQHHERIDGSGYPQGLKGEEILLEARIIAVADVFEAMASHRPYRPGLGTDTAIAELERGRGSAYDAQVVDALVKLVKEKGYTLPQ